MGRKTTMSNALGLDQPDGNARVRGLHTTGRTKGHDQGQGQGTKNSGGRPDFEALPTGNEQVIKYNSEKTARGTESQASYVSGEQAI